MRGCAQSGMRGVGESGLVSSGRRARGSGARGTRGSGCTGSRCGWLAVRAWVGGMGAVGFSLCARDWSGADGDPRERTTRPSSSLLSFPPLFLPHPRIHAASMDAFRTLTGGSRFDKKRFHADMTHFTVSLLSLVVAAPPQLELTHPSLAPISLCPSGPCTGYSTATQHIHGDRSRRARLLCPAQASHRQGPQAQAHHRPHPRRRRLDRALARNQPRLPRPPPPAQDQALRPRPPRPRRLPLGPRRPRPRPRRRAQARKALGRYWHEGTDRGPDGCVGDHARRASFTRPPSPFAHSRRPRPPPLLPARVGGN